MSHKPWKTTHHTVTLRDGIARTTGACCPTCGTCRWGGGLVSRTLSETETPRGTETLYRCLVCGRRYVGLLARLYDGTDLGRPVPVRRGGR